ncbi:cysteine hydrolase family protein [Corynebacterium sp. 335C]
MDSPAGGRAAVPRRPALVAVDVQHAFDDAAFWGRGDNPACEDRIADLLRLWRARGWPVVVVRHDSADPASPLAPGATGHALKGIVDGPRDLLVRKSVNSAFHGEPDLDAWLRAEGCDAVAVCGITTNHCCETTARVGGNLGHDVTFVLDATRTFDRVGPDGRTIPAETLAAVTAANLHGEFADVVDAAGLIALGRMTGPRRTR